MKVLVISDLHIGDGKRADDFGKNDKKLMRWIKKFKADRVYLNGDIYELWQFDPQDIRNAHFVLWKYLHGKKFVHLRGNHDYQLLGPLTKSFKTKSGKRVLISHGFQNDPLMTNPFARFFIWLVGQTLEKWYPDIDNEESYKRKRNKSRTVRNTASYATQMFEKYDLVICGHSHRQGIWRDHEGKTYANCGTCQSGRHEGVLLDTLTDKVKLV